MFAGVLYGLGYPPFKKAEPTPAATERRARERVLTVEVSKVSRGVVADNISAVGSLMANRIVSVAPKINGRVERVLVHVGDKVHAGQLVAELDRRQLNEELNEAKASLQVAQATLKGKQAELEDSRLKRDRAAQLLAKNFISRQELDTLDSERVAAVAQVELTRAQIAQMQARVAYAKLQLSETRLSAPFPGLIDKRLVDPGAFVNTGTAIASIVDVQRVKVVIPVVEKDYPRITVGQAANVSVDAFSKQAFQGKVVRLTPVLNRETRTGEIELEVNNQNGLLKPGMFARVDITLAERTDVLMVPDGALVKNAAGHGVFRLQSATEKGSEVQFVPVRIGVSRAGRTEIQGDLQLDDRVVTLGSSLLKDGQRVRIAGAKGQKGKGKRSRREGAES